MKCTPLMPPVAGSVISTVLVASSVRFKASGVEMSGRGPSAGTASPKLIRVSAMALPGTILPAFSNSSAASRGTIMTS